jgi:hypothetical protein
MQHLLICYIDLIAKLSGDFGHCKAAVLCCQQVRAVMESIVFVVCLRQGRYCVCALLARHGILLALLAKRVMRHQQCG